MSEASSAGGAPPNLVRGCLVVTAPADVGLEALGRLRTDLLDRIRATGCRRVLLDLSPVELMDGEDFELLLRIVRAARLMGARTLLAGVQPGLASALVELRSDLADVETCRDVEDGFERFEAPDPRDAADAPDDATFDDAAPADGGAW
jgi:anti-anti-sigma regulatory factor